MTTEDHHQQKANECKDAFLWNRRRSSSSSSIMWKKKQVILAAALLLLLMVAALQNHRTHSRSAPCQGSVDLLDHNDTGRTCVRRQRRRVQSSTNEDTDAAAAATRNVSSSSSSSSSSSYSIYTLGCLHSVMPDTWTRTTRVCNSQDSPESIACSRSAPTASASASASSPQPEVRIFAQQDSESSIISAWLLQIILSEMLHIPTSIETGVSASASARFNFYHSNHDNDNSDGDASDDDFNVVNPQQHVMLGSPSSAIKEALKNAQLFHQDCTLARRGSSGGDTSSSNSSTTTTTAAAGEEEEQDYQPCAHYIPESWHVNPEIMHNNQELVETYPMGLLLQEGWYIPKFTAHRDATLTSYIGMQNAHPNHSSYLEENRRRHMADTFLQPTTWHDYCNLVSLNACSIPDEHAQHAPSTPEEGEAYYFKSRSNNSSNNNSSGSSGAVLYTGHFQKSGRNDCDNHPTACMGHMGDYPCTWTSYAQAQTHHLNIFLEDDDDNEDDSQQRNSQRGYSIQQLQQLWHAANATQSNLVIMWYDTSFIYHQYQATPAKFIKVTLPPTTQECLDNRVSNDDQCSSDLETRVGSPLGVCDYPVQPLYKLVSAGLRNREATTTTTTTTTTTPKSLASSNNPAYAVLRDFTLSNAQLSEIYDYWMQAKTSAATANSSSSAAAAVASPRQALCQWAADNVDHLESFIPAYYPRSLVDESRYSSSIMVAAVVIASLAMLLVLLVTINVLRLRQQGVMQAGPLQSLYIMLVGAMFLGLGALLAAMPTTNGACTAEVWLVNWGLGVFGLVPIMVKLRAIRQGACIATKSKKTMHDEETTITTATTTITRNNRVVPSAKDVYGAVFLVGVAVSIVLIIWTVVDPPQKQVAGYSIMTDMPPQRGEETIVHVSYYCSSNQIFWNFLSIAWNMFLVACATVLVCQTNKIRQDFNEPTLLAVLVYCHSVFMMLWLISMLLSSSSSSSAAAGNDGNNVNQSSLAGFRSIVFSLDAMVTLLVYFIPKFVVRQEEDDAATGVKALGPIALWISNISGVSSCKSAEDNSVEKGTPPPPPPKSLEQAPRAIPANTTLETHEHGIETSLSNSVAAAAASPYSSDDDDDTGGVAQLRASVDRLKWEGQTLRSEVETKDRTIALLESEVESLMEICMNHPRRGVNMDPSETEGADDSENYIEESPFVVETTLAPTNADKSETDDDDEEEEEEEPGKIQKPTFAEPIGKGNFDYSLSTIYEDVDLAQLRDDEAKLFETMQENQKAAVLASTPRELSKRKKIERALAEIDV